MCGDLRCRKRDLFCCFKAHHWSKSWNKHRVLLLPCIQQRYNSGVLCYNKRQWCLKIGLLENRSNPRTRRFAGRKGFKGPICCNVWLYGFIVCFFKQEAERIPTSFWCRTQLQLTKKDKTEKPRNTYGVSIALPVQHIPEGTWLRVYRLW